MSKRMGEAADPLQQALRMLDAFISVGAQRFDVTLLDIDGEKVEGGFFGKRTVPSMRRNLPPNLDGLGWLNDAEAKMQNLIIRPYSDQVKLIQLDDLKDIERVMPAAFMVIETSPENHQAWVAVSTTANSAVVQNNMTNQDFARSLRKGTGADPTASGATRVAGTRNFKRKYAPDYPIITIKQIEPGRIILPAQLESMGLVAPLAIERKKPTFIVATTRRKVWPDYQRCLQAAPPNHAKDGQGVSRADFHWCLLAATWGFTAGEYGKN